MNNDYLKENSKLPNCPYCNKKLTYKNIYKYRKYDIGKCDHCGGEFSIRYKTISYLLISLVILLALLLFCIQMFTQTNGSVVYSIPIYIAVFLALYFVMPLFSELSGYAEGTPEYLKELQQYQNRNRKRR